jgi:hypothetical protein
MLNIIGEVGAEPKVYLLGPLTLLNIHDSINGSTRVTVFKRSTVNFVEENVNKREHAWNSAAR